MKTRIISILLTITIACSILSNSLAQPKFGKAEKAWVDMTTYEPDPDAEAVILGDYGSSEVKYIQNSGFEVVFKRHTIIKILNKNGYKWADWIINLYENNNVEEDLRGPKGYTYNVSDGKVERIKLENKSVFREKYSENTNKVKFTMPNVQEGSLIEFTYTIISPYLSRFPGWQFQYSIPVAVSEFSTRIPEYYEYLTMFQGHEPIDDHQKNITSGTILWVDKSRTDGYRAPVSTQFEQGSVSLKFENNKWIAKDVPGFNGDSYIPTPKDFMLQVDFQLARTHFPNEKIVNILNSWEEIEETLLEHTDFGKRLDGGKIFDVELVTIDKSDPLKTICQIFDMVSQKIAWDGNKWFLTSQPIRKTWKEGEGNSADINLTLIKFLREAGFQAESLILSTRDNGRVHPVYPNIGKYNYVVAYLELDDKKLIMDATDSDCSPYLPPKRVLNNKGRLISKNNSRWIDLVPLQKSKEFTQAEINIDASGMVFSEIIANQVGYPSLELREEINRNGEEKLVEKISESLENYEASSFEYSVSEDHLKKVNAKYQLKSYNSLMVSDQLMMIDPLFFDKMEENPFKDENREFPVDFTYPINKTISVKINIPDGFEIEELPESTAFGLQDKSGTFRFSVAKQDRSINITNSITLKKTFFNTEEYPELRKFFELAVSKYAELIVLKKTT
ncbi:DUF3858 domain-containing protein [Bacteroidota bacterium]